MASLLGFAIFSNYAIAERDMTSIGEQVRAFRERNAMTVDDLAEKSGVSSRQLFRIESGESMPKAGTLASLAAAFGTDASGLRFGLDNDEIEEIVAENTCSWCGAHLVRRVDVPHAWGEDELTMFACGATRGWEDRPCPTDPRFPRFEDYELVLFETDNQWLCLARGITEKAKVVPLQSGYGQTRELAARWVERSYVEVK